MDASRAEDLEKTVASPATAGAFPTVRMRRLRRSEALREMVRETDLRPSDFVYPLFVMHGKDVKREIGAMPGHYQWPVDLLPREV